MSRLEETHARAGAVGRSVPRRDAEEKLRGKAQFAGDILVPGMLHGKVLRSPYPHARITSIDTSDAETTTLANAARARERGVRWHLES